MMRATFAASADAQGPVRAEVFPGREWLTIPAESAGFSPGTFDAARDALSKTSTTAFVVVSGGRIVFEYGNVDTVSYIASARKSILSMLYGKYIRRGTIKLDATLEQLGIDDIGGLTHAEKQNEQCVSFTRLLECALMAFGLVSCASASTLVEQQELKI